MPRKKTVEGGKTRAFYITDRHYFALQSFQARHSHKSESEAMRALLEMLAESEDAEIEEAKPPAARAS